jgi:3'-5' exonuclease
VRDRQFQALVLVVKPYGGISSPLIITGPEAIEAWVKAQDWPSITVIGHHLQFDSFVLSHCYGARPKFHICTMSMARGLYGPEREASLEALAAKFDLPPKSVP